MSRYPYSIFKLSNGLKVLHVPAPHRETVVIDLIGKVGNRAEKANEIGAAHFLEHLFFDGTTNHPSAFQLEKIINFYGWSYNGHTRTETVNYWVKTLSKHTEIAFDFLSDIFLNSLLREVDLEKERKVIAQEAKRSRDDPDNILSWSRVKTLYPNQKLGQTFFEEEENLANITPKVLKDYMTRNYVANNFVLAVSGNIDEQLTRSLAEKYFLTFLNGPEVKFDQGLVNPEQALVIDNKDLAQSKLSFAFKGFAMNADETVGASILAKVLGSDRIHRKLRHDLHLVYSAGAGITTHSDVGHFTITASADEENIQLATDSIFQQIKKLLDKGIEQEELERAKNSYLSHQAMRFEAPRSYANYLVSDVLFSDRIIELDEFFAQIEGATQEYVMDVARKIFSDKPKTNLLSKTLTELQVPEI